MVEGSLKEIYLVVPVPAFPLGTLGTAQPINLKTGLANIHIGKVYRIKNENVPAPTIN